MGLVVVAALAGGALAFFLTAGGDGPTGKRNVAQPSRKPASPKPPEGEMTPSKAKKLVLKAGTKQKGGASRGFPYTANGGISAVVYFWEEYAFLDDSAAREQLKAVTSHDSTGYIEEQISEVRKLREYAGLPPSGGAPAGITFTTNVNAVRATSLDDTGAVMQIWLAYDQYATKADGGADQDPLKGEEVDFIVKWQDGDWKITNEPQYVKQRSFPVAYHPASPYASRDGWQRVRHEE
ncbi:hypothetical protein RCO28_30845 [Streptomyces sp. LHD-70]|uniref:hypothetical protein n=1 Tax=Streptomyces sp. LHD-70 TaxID=3072140 RepID=UPI00280E21E8|nr:hypothetical protein [Streptomyces sp. LHD-70]MDQ8706836.1 hypothetical protein [Streptomyces sp. LHD-70]